MWMSKKATQQRELTNNSGTAATKHGIKKRKTQVRMSPAQMALKKKNFLKERTLQKTMCIYIYESFLKWGYPQIIQVIRHFLY